MTPPRPRKPYEADQKKITRLGENLERILRDVATRRNGPEDDPAIYRCRFCQDTGVVMKTEGVFDVGGVRGSTVYRGGKSRKTPAPASMDRPVFVRCIGCNPVKGPEQQSSRRRDYGAS